MKKNKRGKLGPISISFIVLVFIASSYLFYCDRFGYRVAKGVTQSNLMKLRIGMPEAEVLQTIGAPLHQDRYPRIFIYAEPCAMCLDGIELFLKYENGLLAYAGAENYDLGFWLLRDASGPIVSKRGDFEKYIRK